MYLVKYLLDNLFICIIWFRFFLSVKCCINLNMWYIRSDVIFGGIRICVNIMEFVIIGVSIF